MVPKVSGAYSCLEHYTMFSRVDRLVSLGDLLRLVAPPLECESTARLPSDGTSTATKFTLKSHNLCGPSQMSRVS